MVRRNYKKVNSINKKEAADTPPLFIKNLKTTSQY